MHGDCWRRRCRCGRVGRQPIPLKVSLAPLVDRFTPNPQSTKEPIYLDVVELEALKLIDLDNLSFEEAGLRMNTSRNTVWRIVKSAREKLVRALIEGREIIIQK
ncbi:MAG: DUF134 domain-containing protein [archaeon YNP-WB-040]|jgi:predicted DNA-binding protein (UPF0251 family)|nr:DUF134 domain-containing protein [Candidatus Culexarchaeum yellowstonense]